MVLQTMPFGSLQDFHSLFLMCKESYLAKPIIAKSRAPFDLLIPRTWALSGVNDMATKWPTKR